MLSYSSSITSQTLTKANVSINPLMIRILFITLFT